MANNSEAGILKFDVEKIRNEFPILKLNIKERPLVYLDNAATTHKPRVVIDAIKNYYETQNSNIHRGVHYLSELSTSLYENSRKRIAGFLNAKSPDEIVFTRGTTEGINLVAQTFVKSGLKEGDEIIISNMEHHSNIVPWQMICEEKKAKLKVIPITDEGELILEEFEKLISEKTKFVSIVHISNSLGTINPIEKIIQTAHMYKIPVLIDGAQSVAHTKIDVQKLGCDFFVFSGHKIFGPTGIGALYGKAEHLEKMPPYQGGGDMIMSVRFEKTLYNEVPFKFEAGTPNIEGAIVLGKALEFVEDIGLENIFRYESELLEYANSKISQIPGIKFIGTAKEKAGILSFTLCGIHPHDIGTIISTEGVAIRTGHHCTQPVMERFGIPATARASFAMYNTKEEVDQLYSGIQKVIEVFK